MRIRHIYWFAYFDAGEPSVRYRALYPLSEMERRDGITYTFVCPGRSVRNILLFICAYFSALLFRKRDSLIVFQKIYSPGLYASALKLLLYFRPARTLYDIDDAEHTRRPAGTIHYFLRRCAACAAGSAALIEYIRPFNPHVFLLTSPVPDHGVERTLPDSRFRIGWIGYYGAHQESLMQLLFPAIRQLGFPVTLSLLGVQHAAELAGIKAYFEACPDVLIDAPLHIDWLDENAVYSGLSGCSIGVSPLLDTEFNRAKSAFKLKQCLSCGIPVLGSSIGENARFLRNGVNGFFCDSPEEYRERIGQVRAMTESQYGDMAAAAIGSIPSFSIDGYCAALYSFYERAHPARRIRVPERLLVRRS